MTLRESPDGQGTKWFSYFHRWLERYVETSHWAKWQIHKLRRTEESGSRSSNVPVRRERGPPWTGQVGAGVFWAICTKSAAGPGVWPNGGGLASRFAESCKARMGRVARRLSSWSWQDWAGTRKWQIELRSLFAEAAALLGTSPAGRSPFSRLCLHPDVSDVLFLLSADLNLLV